MTRSLMSYLPYVLRDYTEIQAILVGQQPELDQVWEAAESLLENQFIVSAEGLGLGRWEKILGITPRARTAWRTDASASWPVGMKSCLTRSNSCGPFWKPCAGPGTTQQRWTGPIPCLLKSGWRRRVALPMYRPCWSGSRRKTWCWHCLSSTTPGTKLRDSPGTRQKP